MGLQDARHSVWLYDENEPYINALDLLDPLYCF